jgi:hypothetical protein
METQTHPHSHPHSHPHDEHSHEDHDHVHHSATEVRSQPVVLDLGEGVGALIVYTGGELLGTEVEISPGAEDGNRQHKEVLRRTMGRETVNVLVYDNLPEGTYTLWIDGVAKERGVAVRGGSVAELDWRAL